MTGSTRIAAAALLAAISWTAGRWTAPEAETVVAVERPEVAFAVPAWKAPFQAVRAASGASELRASAHEALNSAEAGPALADAIELLGWTGDQADAEWLEAIALSKDPELVDPAIRALGRLGGDRSVDALLALSAERDTAWSALDALGSTGDERAWASLVAHLDHPQHGPTAAMALARFGTDASAAAVIEALDRARPASVPGFTRALARFPGETARARLYEQLRTGSRVHREAALSALAEIRDPMVLDLLLDDLERGSNAQKAAAAHHLGALGDPSAVPALEDAAVRGSRDVQSAAVGALSRIDTRTARNALLALIDTGPEGVAQQAIWSLSSPEDADAVEVLVGSWRRRSWNTRSAITQRLFGASWTRGEVPPAVLDLARAELVDPPPGGHVNGAAFLLDYGTLDDVAMVEGRLRDGPSAMRSQIVWALSQWPGPAAERLLFERIEDSDPNVRDSAVRALLQRGTDPEHLEGPLLALLDSPRLQHGQTEQLLVELGTPSALAAVQRRITEGTQRERSAATQALAWSGDRAATDALRDAAAATEEPGERRNIYQTLMWTPDGMTEDVVDDLLEDDDPMVRSLAVQALAQRGPAGREALLELARNDEDEVRISAIGFLGQAGGDEAEAMLVDAMDDPETRYQALSGLQQLGTRSAGQTLLQAATEHPDPTLRSAALNQLAWAGVEGGADALAVALDDEDDDVRRSALNALEGLGNTAAARSLARLLDDPDDPISLDAAYALQRMGGSVADRAEAAIDDRIEQARQDAGDTAEHFEGFEDLGDYAGDGFFVDEW